MAPSISQNKKKKKKKGAETRRNVWLLVLAAVLVIGSIFMFTPPQEKINQGLDIQGGLSVVLTATGEDGSVPSAEDMEKSRAIIESRVNALGASEASVQVQGANQILVQIPGMSDTEEALNTIGKTGKLEFARLDSFTDEDVVSKIESGQYGQDSYTYDEFGNAFPTGEQAHLEVAEGTYTPLFTGENITNVSIGQASQTSTDFAVNVSLDAEGTQAFAEATQDLVSTNGQIVIILDGEVQSAPAVQDVITDGQVSITGGYDRDGAFNLQTVLQSGSLPISFEYSQSQVVGPTLGQDALASGVVVAVIGLVVVLLYLIFFYRGLGVIAAAMIGVFAVFYLGLLALLSHFGLFSLSLAGIAGVVLTIGMAADSSILVLERFREEIRMGRSVRGAAKTGVWHGITTSIDADLVTLVSALTLFFLASASVKGFGLTLALGIACDLVAMLVFIMPVIRLLAPRAITRHPAFWEVKDCLDLAEAEASGTLARKPRGRFIKRDIDFLGKRKVFFAIAAVMIVAAFAIVGFRGLNFGIEFQGGTSISMRDTGNVTIEQVRDAFADAGEPDAVVQTTSSDGQEGFLVRTATTSAEDAAATANQVADQFGWSHDSIEVTTIGPDWGAGVIQSSLIALLVSFALIIAYIAVRFEYKMGICAIIALLHDIIIVVGVYALVGREVTPNAVAALLTILGYSLYDKVVVFHRINENMKTDEGACSFLTMANRSLNQVIIRTMNTSIAQLVPVVAMLLFGGETLKDFAFAMTIGLVCGAYSTISVATPLYSIWKSREPKYAHLAKKFGPEVQRCYLGYLPNDPRVAGFFAAEGAAAPADGEGAAADLPDTAEGAPKAGEPEATAVAAPVRRVDGDEAKEAMAHRRRQSRAQRKGKK
ncbi:MAG TPA: protein translocase subunit SecD [Candidatus Aphodovivens avistercoris]|nr:protein translocase subunit SecD [Candidatus Aphodovivens avistercoris]